MDMLNSARYLKAHQLSMGKLGVTGFCWGGSTTNYLAVTLGADMHAGVVLRRRCRDLRRAPDQGTAVHPLRRERRAQQRDVAGLRDGAAEVPHVMHKYPGTQHGYHNNSMPRFDEPAKLAWDGTIAHFKKYLA